jgi:uncharacterized protein (DUF58 family)
MRKRCPPWLIVAVCGAVGVLLAMTVLGGAAQGYVAVASTFAVLLAIARGLDSPGVQTVERQIAKDEVGSGNYRPAVGSKRPDPSPVGPVNTPQQDQVDALERAWRASPPADH